DGELLIGTIDGPTGTPAWYTGSVPPADLYHPNLNAVRVQIERQRVRVSTTAYVDRDVVGFKVHGSSHILKVGGNPAVPVVPFAVLSDWSMMPSDKSWEHNIIESGGADAYSLDSAGQPINGSDGIPEITVRLAGETDNGQVIGIPDP